MTISVQRKINKQRLITLIKNAYNFLNVAQLLNFLIVSSNIIIPIFISVFENKYKNIMIKY